MKKTTKRIFAVFLSLCMTFSLLPQMVMAASEYSANFSYNGMTYSTGNITGSSDISLSTLLSALGITGTVTEASVSEDQGMSVTTDTLTLTQAFGTGWLRVTADGVEHQITITSLPNSISVVFYGALSFQSGGGSGIMDSISVREYTYTVIPECTFTPPDGYEFDAWEINDTRYQPNDVYFFGKSITAKALWKKRDGVHDIQAIYNTEQGDVIIKPTKAAQGENVTVTVQPVAGKVIDSIYYETDNASNQSLTPKEGETGVYTFFMTNADTTVTVNFKDGQSQPIAYVDENNTQKSCESYNYVRPTDTEWTSGWIIASQNLTLDNRIKVNGTVNLILMDNKTLTVTDGISVTDGNTLNIYSQTGNSGKLNAGNKANSSKAGIGGDNISAPNSYPAGNITINGGHIEAVGGYRSAGIGGGGDKDSDGGSITIQGSAYVSATGGQYGAGIGGGMSGSGGVITIKDNADVTACAVDGYGGSGAGIGGGDNGSAGTIKIEGGNVNATGGNQGNAIGSGCGKDGGSISITGGSVTAIANGSYGAGIGGQCESITIGGTASVYAKGASNGAGIGSYKEKSVGNITIEGNAYVEAVNGSDAAAIGGGNKAAGGNITITGGTVNAYAVGESGPAAIGSGGYGSTEKTTITITGGTVSAKGNSIFGVGIGGGNSGVSGEEVEIDISGGVVKASGRVGIGTANASNAKLTINISDGTVIATGAVDGSNKCAAIGQGNNSNSETEINITGGIVKTLGTGNGIGAGSNSKQTPDINLSYTNESKDTIEISAINYNGNVVLNSNFIYKDDKTEVSTPIKDNATIVCEGSTAHNHNFTYTANGRTITATCSAENCPLDNHTATLTIAEPDGNTTMVYNGAEREAVITGDTDVITTDIVYKKDNNIIPYAPVDVGTYTATLSLGESTASVSYSITKKPVTMSNISIINKEYDGTTKANTSFSNGLNGAIGGDSVSASWTEGKATYDTADVGTSKKVTFTGWTLTGSSKGNYELIQPEDRVAMITPRRITIKAKEQTVGLNSAVSSGIDKVEISTGSLASGQSISEITLTPSGTSAVTTEGTITPSAVKIMDADNNDVTSNYEVSYLPGTLTVSDSIPTCVPPTAADVTDTTVTLNEVTGQGTVEYGVNTTNQAPSQWQAAPEFTGLTPNTQYYFFVKVADEDNINSVISEGTAVKTLSATVTTSITFTDEAKAEIVSFTDEDDNEITEDMYGSLTPDIQYSLVMRVPVEIEVDDGTFSSNDDTYFYYDFYPYEGEEISVSLADLITIEFDGTAAGYTVKMERRTGGFGTAIFSDFEVDKNGKTELTPGVYEIESVEPLNLITVDGQTSVPWMTYYYAYDHYYYYFEVGQYASDIKVWVSPTQIGKATLTVTDAAKEILNAVNLPFTVDYAKASLAVWTSYGQSPYFETGRPYYAIATDEIEIVGGAITKTEPKDGATIYTFTIDNGTENAVIKTKDEQSYTVIVTGGEGITDIKLGNISGTKSENTYTFTNVYAGEYTFDITYAEGYEKAASSPQSITVSADKRTETVTAQKKTITEITAPTIASKTYTGDRLTADVAESEYYTITANEGGINVGDYDVVLTLKDAENTKWTDSAEAAKTLTFKITKANQTVSAPTTASVTDTTVALNEVTGQGTVEYGVNTTNEAPSQWQSSAEFTGLTADTQYYFFVKISGDDNYNGAISEGTSVKTAEATPVIPTAYDIKFTDNNKVSLASPDNGEYCVIFAAYKNNALVSIKTVENITFTSAGTQTVDIPAEFDITGADTVKAFFWRGLTDMTPLCSFAQK